MQKLKASLKNRTLLTLLGIVGGVILLIAIFITLQRKNDTSQRISDTTQAKIYFQPNSGTQFGYNTQISVDVLLDAMNQDVTGIVAEVQYDNTKLRLDSIDKTESSFGQDNTTVNPSLDANKARITADKPEDNPVTGNGKQVATLIFTTIASGTANLEFTNNSLVEIVVNGQSTNLSIEKTSATYTIGQSTTPGVSVSPGITNSISITPGEGADICLPIGDVNEDGSVTNADLSLLRSYLDGNTTLTPVQMNKANLTGSTSSKRPYEEDYNRLKLLLEGEGNRVFPGEPPICPTMHGVFIGFSENDVTLNKSILTPTKNKIAIYNPEKKNIENILISLSFPSDAIRITKITPLNNTQLTQIGSNNTSFRINGPIPAHDMIEVAEIDVVPFTLGFTRNNGELKVNTFMVYDDGVGPSENFRPEARYATVNYTIIDPEASITGSTSTPTQNATATPINASPPAGGASIRIRATTPGIGTLFASDNKNPVEKTKQVQVQLTRAGTNTPITASGTLSFSGNEYDGYVIVPNITPGNYQIKARFNNTLYKIIPGVYNLQDTSSISTSVVALNSGDLNQDNRINLLDYNILLSCIQNKTACTNSYKTLSDLNSSGSVGPEDLNIFLRQLEIREGD